MSPRPNRMVHFCAEISRDELYEICAQQLDDVLASAEAIRQWIGSHPDLVDQAL